MSGCGSGNCQCAGKAQEAPAAINGIALHAPGEKPSPDELRERAWAELLRQEAVRQGLLPRMNVLEAPELGEAQQDVLQQMVEDAVQLPSPGEEALRRYYDAHRERYVEGQSARVRHILFAVTDGVDVGKLAAKAEEVLLELARKDAHPALFEERARELSNCPSGAQGGDTGWIAPHEIAPELAAEIFFQKVQPQASGLRTRLVHSRFGLHILDVLERKDGRQLSFDEVRGRIGMELAQRTRATAVHQYIRVLAGKANIEGVDLEQAHSPLVQ